MSRTDLESHLQAMANPVSTIKEACSWLKAKGWMLAGEQYSKKKLADILLTVVIVSKLPTEANLAIRLVAFLIRDLMEEDLSSSLADKIADKIATKLSQPIDNLNSSIASAKTFLDATSQKQATELLNLQDMVKHSA